MQMAEDARVEVLNSELSATQKGKTQPKIDRLQSDEDLNVLTGEELAKERSEEYALRRRGDIE